jgi:hypothetical protein
MRPRADRQRIDAFLRELGRAAVTPTRLYLTGGATAVIEGWRETTVDIDVHIEPDVDALLRRIPELKERIGVNVELASPAQFIPELPGWRERSPFVLRAGELEAFHFDLYSQVLSKLERAFDQDLEDARAMVASGLVDPSRAKELFEVIEPELYRFPAIDPASFRARVERELGRRPGT